MSALCPPPTDLIAFDRGALSRHRLDHIADHIAGCEACLTRLAGLAVEERGTIHERWRGLGRVQADPYSDDPDYQRMCGRALRLIDAPHTAGPAEETPAHCGPYRLLGRIGHGGMGTVYKAEHPRLRRAVALKMLNPGRTADPGAVTRFQREMAAVGQLTHDNVVRATDAGEADGVHYLVMDLIDGCDLSRLVTARGPLPVAESCELARRAARGLHAAHLLRLVHRDIKPSNLILSTAGELKVVDFGLASLGSDPVDGLTRDDQMMGTADYMAPEQWRSSHTVDGRADVYALGCTLYFLITGKPPFGRRKLSLGEKMDAHRRERPRSLADVRPGVPVGLAAVVGKMLAKAACDRHATADEVVTALAPYAAGADLAALTRGAIDAPPVLTEPSVDRPRSRRWIAGAVLGGLMTAAALLAMVLLPGAKPAGPPVVRTFQPGVVHTLLDVAPTELWWYNPARTSFYAHEPNARRLRLESMNQSLLALGTGPGQFTLTMTFRQPRWTGQFGLFIGGTRNEVTGEVCAHKFEFFPRGKTFRVRRTNGTYQPRPGMVPFIAEADTHGTELKNLPGPAPMLIRVVADGSGISQVMIDGVPYGDLCDGGKRPVVAGAYAGQFGLFARGSSVSLMSAEYFPHD